MSSESRTMQMQIRSRIMSNMRTAIAFVPLRMIQIIMVQLLYQEERRALREIPTVPNKILNRNHAQNNPSWTKRHKYRLLASLVGVIVLLMWYMRIEGSSQQLLDYQEKCNLTETTTTTTETSIGIPRSSYDILAVSECDYRKYLECRNTTSYQGYCDCKTLEVTGEGGSVTRYSLHYMKDVSTCVSPPEGPCWKRFYDEHFELPCSRNAQCVQANLTVQGHCECKKGYSHKPETDECVAGYEDPCSGDDDCDEYSHLVCSESEQKCVCESDSEWNNMASPPTCVGLVGGRCDNNPQRRKGCIEDAVCGADNLCRCNATFQAGSDHHCYKTYNQSCTVSVSLSSECHENFQCLPRTEGTGTACLCPDNYDVSDRFDLDNRRCLGRSGETCQLHPEKPDEISFCTPYSTCINGTVAPDSFKCECDAGYSENDGKFCRGNHGTQCDGNEGDSTTPEDSLCNERLKLTCNTQGNETEWTCECIANHRYDNALDKCLGEEGAQCQIGNDCVTKHCTNANTCGCPAGSTISNDGTKCLFSFGAQCNPDDSTAICNPALLLGCSNGVCNCSNVEEFIKEESFSRCSVMAGKSCSETDRQGKCVEFSQCTPDSSGNSICQCIGGYQANSLGKCDLKSSASKLSLASYFSLALVLFATFLK